MSTLQRNLVKKTLINATKSHNYSPKAYPIGSRPGKSAPGVFYDLGKRTARYFGYYQDIRPYLPEERIKDIKDYPVKHAVAWQKFWSKKTLYASNNKYRKAHRGCDFHFGYYSPKQNNCQSG